MMTMMGNWYVFLVLYDDADESGVQGGCEEKEVVI